MPSNLTYFSDAFGRLGTYSTAGQSGAIDFNNPFFKSLGSNGRSCKSCHQPDQGWSITPVRIQKIFDNTKGLDPLFAAVDGTNNPSVNRSTLAARSAASSLLRTKGLIRVGIAPPSTAEFDVIAVDDPYGNSAVGELSMFRRPLPTGNISALAEVMWDGRQSPPGRTLHDNLIEQAAGATIGHAEGARPTATQLEQIAQFQLKLIGAQFSDNTALRLDVAGASGGPIPLSVALANHFTGINDPFGGNFNPQVLSLFTPWASLTASPFSADFTTVSARNSVARGEQIFNSRSFQITSVGGLNGPFDATQAPITGTCSTCHNSPGIGNHSQPLQLVLGVGNPGGLNADLPVFTLRLKNSAANCALTPLPSDCRRTTDAGQALISGLWADVGKFKVPGLRNLAARAPFFHGGSHAQLENLVGFYNFRFQMGLTNQERTDLVNFLRAL